MAQEQINMCMERESEDPTVRRNKSRVLKFGTAASISTAIAVIIFGYSVLSSETKMLDFPNSIIAVIVLSLMALCFWMGVVLGVVSLYYNSLKQFHETGDRLLTACKERDSLIIKLDLMREEKVAIEGYWYTETQRREEAEDRLAKRIESESA